MADKLLAPDRLMYLLKEYLDRSVAAQAGRREKLRVLRAEGTEIDGQLRKLFTLVKTGIMTPDDPALGERVAQIRLQRQETEGRITLLERELNAQAYQLTAEKITAFGTLVREQLKNGTVEFRKAYLNFFIDRIEVDDTEVRIMGRVSALAGGASGKLPKPSDTVPSYVREWRTRQDFELVTSAFGGQRSIQLSYGCMPRNRPHHSERRIEGKAGRGAPGTGRVACAGTPPSAMIPLAKRGPGRGRAPGAGNGDFDVGSRRSVVLLALAGLLIYVAWIGGPYLRSINVRDAAVTTWINHTASPIRGYVDEHPLYPGERVGADGRIATVEDALADQTPVVRAEADLERARTGSRRWSSARPS